MKYRIVVRFTPGSHEIMDNHSRFECVYEIQHKTTTGLCFLLVLFHNTYFCFVTTGFLWFIWKSTEYIRFYDALCYLNNLNFTIMLSDDFLAFGSALSTNCCRLYVLYLHCLSNTRTKAKLQLWRQSIQVMPEIINVIIR